MRDPYEVLGVQRGATDDEIKKAYRAKCKRWHPDLNPNDPTAEEHFKEVQAAYDAITKGDTGPQMGGNPYGGYQQQGYGQQNYQQQGLRLQNGFGGFDGFDGFDPFGFGFGFGGYQQASRAQAIPAPTAPEMQAARNFVANGRYAGGAPRTGRHDRPQCAVVLPVFPRKSGAWATRIDALCRMPAVPCSWTRATPSTGCTCAGCRTPARPTAPRPPTPSPGGLMQWCWSMILLNLLCNCCCGGWGFRGFRM